NMLNSSDFDASDSEDVLRALSTSTRVLDQIIMDLNLILQVRSNINEQSEVVSFPELVDNLKRSLGSLMEKENVRIKVDFTSCESMVTIRSYMYSIFYNLVLNSIKYKRVGTDPVISIFTRKKGDRLEITFKDNGRGIEEKNFKNLFGLYKRFDTNVEGKGIGLFMVKMQVENLGGKISVQSEPGAGATFKLEFAKVSGGG